MQLGGTTNVIVYIDCNLIENYGVLFEEQVRLFLYEVYFYSNVSI